MANGWENVASIPRTGEVILAAWSVVWRGERAWRYRLILWEDDGEGSGEWIVCPALVGAAYKREHGPKSGHFDHRPEHWGGSREIIPEPDVWRHIFPPPDAPKSP